MKFKIGLRKLVVLKVGLISPLWDSMKSCLTSMIVFKWFFIHHGFDTILQKATEESENVKNSSMLCAATQKLSCT